MNPANTNLVHAAMLVGLGIWSFFGSNATDVRYLAFIFGGTVLFVLTNSIRFYNKSVIRIASGLTFILLLYTAYLFYDSIGRYDPVHLYRSIALLVSGTLHLFFLQRVKV